jgi:Sulfotransferase family
LPEAPPIAPAVTVTGVTTAAPDGALAGLNLQEPHAGATGDVYSLPLAGWVVPARAAPTEIHIHGAQRRLPRVPVAIGRPDIAALHPDLPWAGTAGFAARLNTIHLPRRFGLGLNLLLEDGTRTPLGSIEGERRPLPVYEAASIQPLLVTTLGRSGSTWLTWLLGCHPEIADYRSFEYESKVAAYFAEVLRALTQPSSYFQAVRGDIDNSGWWLGREPRWALPWYRSHDAVDDWLGREHVEDLIAFFAGRADALYGRLAEAVGKPDAAYVVEKLPPIYFAQRIMWEVFPGTREIFLVRDFRDVACSIFAFGAKRGRRWYWERDDASDEDCIRELLRDEVDALAEAWSERHEQALLLRYEDLVLRPEQSLAEVFSHLGVDARPATVERVLDDAARLDSGFRERHATTGSAAESVGRWRNELAAPLRRACEETFGEALEAFGYS